MGAAGRAEVALVARGLVLILAPREARAWRAHAGIALAAGGDADVGAAAADGGAGAAGGEVEALALPKAVNATGVPRESPKVSRKSRLSVVPKTPASD